jgi:hypothetical protein
MTHESQSMFVATGPGPSLRGVWLELPSGNHRRFHVPMRTVFSVRGARSPAATNAAHDSGDVHTDGALGGSWSFRAGRRATLFFGVADRGDDATGAEAGLGFGDLSRLAYRRATLSKTLNASGKRILTEGKGKRVPAEA